MWQGCQFWNRTFEEELSKVDVSEIRQLIDSVSEAREDAFSGATVPLAVAAYDSTAAEVIGQSRARYGTRLQEVESYMEELFAPEPVKRRRTRAGTKKQGGDGKSHGTGNEQSKDAQDKNMPSESAEG